VGATERLAPVKERRATPFARSAFTIWGLMTEIIGATLVVAPLVLTALALAVTGFMTAV
jgi:hypothetical protein